MSARDGAWAAIDRHAEICFTHADLAAFARASGDRNPLHGARPGYDPDVDAPVVYGVLGVLAALSGLRVGPDLALRTLRARFEQPLVPGGRYLLRRRALAAGALTAALHDSDLPVLSVSASFAPSAAPVRAVGEEPRRLARPPLRSLAECRRGLRATGRYGAGAGVLAQLLERFELAAGGLGPDALNALLCTSYVLGMRLPGAHALMSGLDLVLAADAEGRQDAPRTTEPLAYSAEIVELDRPTGLLTVALRLEQGGRRIARCICQAHLPVRSAQGARREVELRLGASRRLAGRVAVVIGASRGLGAALTWGLASQGCTVYACSRGGGAVPRGAGAVGAIEPVRGDGADPGFCGGLRERIVRRHGGLDLLVCCAAPRLAAIGFGEHSVARFNAFVARSVELVTVPMAGLLCALRDRGGSCLVISSSAVETLPAQWGHYVAAKAAGEGLAAWGAKRFPMLELIVARVPRLAGDGHAATSTGAGELSTGGAAAQLVARLARPAGPGLYLIEL